MATGVIWDVDSKTSSLLKRAGREKGLPLEEINGRFARTPILAESKINSSILRAVLRQPPELWKFTGNPPVIRMRLILEVRRHAGVLLYPLIDATVWPHDPRYHLPVALAWYESERERCWPLCLGEIASIKKPLPIAFSELN